VGAHLFFSIHGNRYRTTGTSIWPQWLVCVITSCCLWRALLKTLSKIFLVFVAFVMVAAPAVGADASALQLEIALDPANRQLKVVALVRPSSADFLFELHKSLDIHAAMIGAKPVPIVSMGSKGDSRWWRVQLPTAESILQLEYGGTLPELDRSLDHRGVLRNLSPMASREGSFLPAGGAWYPRPAQRFSYTVGVTIAGEQRVLVPGRLLSEDLPTLDSNAYHATFASVQASDGVDLMAGPWVVREKIMSRTSGGSVRIRTYFTHELDATPGLADGYLHDVQGHLEVFSNEIGAYPFTEFSVVASPLPTGFGMPTLTYLGADVLKLPFVRATSLGHEVLHNWWGNGVYVEYTQGNWCEGLTTFMADYAYRERESSQAAHEMRLGWLRDFSAVPIADRQSLASFRSRTHGASATVGYGKSAMLFSMLRDVLGPDVFKRGIRHFWNRHQFKEASWSELRASFEQASGQQLGVFFDQWLNRTDGPRIGIERASARQVAGKVRLELEILQRGAPYHLRLPLGIDYSDHSETRWIDTKQPSEIVTLDLATMPVGVRLDPDLRVWRLLDADKLPPILRRWITAQSPRLAFASQSAELRDVGQRLATRFFEGQPQPLMPELIKRSPHPVLLIGLHAEVDAVLAANNLPPRPADFGMRGSAQVWTVNQPGNVAVAVISAKDLDALRALFRPLPHYGAQSWLVFEGSRLVERGIWPVQTDLVTVKQGN
jgi:aminopeptidase N